MRRLPPRSNRTAPPVTYTTLFRSNAVETAHVGPQSLRNGNRAIGVLIILDHGDQRPADREAGAVERMDEACPLLARRAKPGLHAPRLKIPTVGAARNLARTEARRVGKECVSKGRYRWSPYHYKKNIITKYNYI